MKSDWMATAALCLLLGAGCSALCEEELVDDPSEFDDFEAAANAESFCSEPTLAIVLGEVAEQGEWTQADWPLDGDEASFTRGPAEGWREHLGLEMTSMSSIIEVEVVATFDTGDDEPPAWEGEVHVQATRAGSGASNQRFWGLQVFLPCELYPEDVPGPPCERLGVQYEDVLLDLTVVVSDHAQRTVAASHTGPIRVQE